MELSSHLTGWFALCESKELINQNSIAGNLFGKPYVLSRSGNRILFNGSAENVREYAQLYFVWSHPTQSTPCWDLPHLANENWTKLLYQPLIARTHPQEIYENSVDDTHFAIVHGFKEHTKEFGPDFNNHIMRIKHSIACRNPFTLGLGKVTAYFELNLYGLGCIITYIHIPSLRLRVRMIATSTILESGVVQVYVGAALATKDSFFHKILLPKMHKIIHQNIVKDFSRDIPIWENKIYRAKPLLVKGDGKIIKFRNWCRQFFV